MVLLFFGLVLCICVSAEDSTYSESLKLRQLGSKTYLSHFSFHWQIAEHAHENMNHVTLLPKPLFLLLSHHQVETLHLSFTQGRWLFDDWGLPPAGHAPIGVDMSASFLPLRLRLQLQRGNSNTSTAVDEAWRSLAQSLGGLFCASMQFVTEGNSWTPAGSERSRHGSLPQEHVCTENLSPFLKMLPCGSSLGYAASINPLNMYHHYHSMRVDYSMNSLTLSISVVHDRFAPTPKTSCPLATKSTLLEENAVVSAPFQATRFITGYGQEKGGVTTVIRNMEQRDISLHITEVVPSEFRVYLHTLQPKVSLGDLVVSPGGLPPNSNPTVMELNVTLAANATVRLHYQFEKNFLQWTKYPPDAHRGFDIPASIISSSSFTMYTESLLSLFPTPDFSMPFNVITLSGTLVSFFFGSMLGVLNQDFSPLKKAGGTVQSRRPIARLARFILRIIDGEY